MRRIVVKVGSSSLTTAAGGIDEQRVDALVDVLGALAGRGREVVLVSSGAIAAGLAPLRLRRRPRDLATQQAAASVGQGLLIGRYAAGFARHGLTVGQVLLTVDDVTRRAPDFRIVSYATAKGCAAAYFPETNVLVPLDSTADTSNTPTSKSIVVRLEPTRTE